MLLRHGGSGNGRKIYLIRWLIKVLFSLYNSASFIPAWTTGSMLLFNWLLNQFFMSYFFFCVIFFSVSTWNIGIWNVQDVIILVDDFLVQYLSIIHHHASRSKKTTSCITWYPVTICFKKRWKKCMNAPC